MPSFISEVITAFSIGLITPLLAVCVLPLYPGFLAYLSNKFSNKPEEINKKRIFFLGLLVSLGILIFMFAFGLIFTTFLQVSLTGVIEIVSPIAFGILALISLLLLFGFDFSKVFPRIRGPVFENPILGALSYGFFFGAIIIPCSPATIAAFFARTVLITDTFTVMASFLAFGLGIAAPLLVLAGVSAAYSIRVIGFLTKHKTAINRIAGAIMLVISIYYLLCVFSILGNSAFIEAICKPLDLLFSKWTEAF